MSNRTSTARVSHYAHDGAYCIVIDGTHHHFSQWPVAYVKGAENQVVRTIRTIAAEAVTIEFLRRDRAAAADIYRVA